MGKEEKIKTKPFTRKVGTVDLAHDRKSNAVSTKSLRKNAGKLALKVLRMASKCNCVCENGKGHSYTRQGKGVRMQPLEAPE